MVNWSQHYSTYRLGDWLSILALIVTYVIIYFIQPHHRLVNPNDVSLMYPRTTETVSAGLLFFLAVGIPLLCFAAYYWFRRHYAHTRAEMQNILLAFFLAIILDLITTDCIKKMTGRPRPNFYALAGWNGQQQHLMM